VPKDWRNDTDWEMRPGGVTGRNLPYRFRHLYEQQSLLDAGVFKDGYVIAPYRGGAVHRFSGLGPFGS
jgi:hypothetical protein